MTPGVSTGVVPLTVGAAMICREVTMRRAGVKVLLVSVMAQTSCIGSSLSAVRGIMRARVELVGTQDRGSCRLQNRSRETIFARPRPKAGSLTTRAEACLKNDTS